MLNQLGQEFGPNTSRRLLVGRPVKASRANDLPFSKHERIEAIGLKRTLDSTIMDALTAADSSLRLGENLAFAALSANDQANCTLHREEAQLLSPRACRKKRAEFALGREAAHLALQQIGIEDPAAVLRGEGGEPLWPQRTVGSITHCYPWSIAVVAKYSNRLAIGIDLESTQRAKEEIDISQLVCLEDELDWIRAGDNFAERLVTLFSAKEAVYKAFYLRCRRYIDFKEVQLSWHPEQSCFHGEFLGALGAAVLPDRACVVHSRRWNDLIFSYLVHEPN